MRISRSLQITSSGPHVLLIENQFHSSGDSLTLEGREIIRKILFDAAESKKIEIISWCLLPRSYRVIIKLPGSRKYKISNQNSTLVSFMKSFQQRVNSWRKYAADKDNIPKKYWRDRYRTSKLSTKGEILAASISVDAFPMILGLTSEPDEYFFTSLYHACQGDKDARKSIAKVVGEPDATWRKNKTTYLKLINQVLEQV